MKQLTYTVNDELGLHARPAGLLVKAASGFQSKITIENGDKKADARRIMAVMSLGAKKGSVLNITVEGEDEEAAAAALEDFLKANL